MKPRPVVLPLRDTGQKDDIFTSMKLQILLLYLIKVSPNMKDITSNKWNWWDVLLVARPLHYRDLKARLKRLSRRSLQFRIR